MHWHSRIALFLRTCRSEGNSFSHSPGIAENTKPLCKSADAPFPRSLPPAGYVAYQSPGTNSFSEHDASGRFSTSEVMRYQDQTCAALQRRSIWQACEGLRVYHSTILIVVSSCTRRNYSMCVRFPSYGKGLDNYLYLFKVHWRPSVWVLEDHRANLNHKFWYFAGHFETIRKRTAHELLADLRTRTWGRLFNQSPRLPLCKMQVHPQRIGVVERHQRLLCLFLVSLLPAARTLKVSSTPQFNLQCYDKPIIIVMVVLLRLKMRIIVGIRTIMKTVIVRKIIKIIIQKKK